MTPSTEDVIGPGKVVSIHYVLRNDEGEILDQSELGAPLEYLHGNGNIVPGLERELEGHAIGDHLFVDVAPADGYGEWDPDGEQTVPRTSFPTDVDIEVGMPFTAEDEQGRQLDVWVTDVTESEVTVDANHPLAGETLHFEVTVARVRDATLEERLHGHPHGPGGHAH